MHNTRRENISEHSLDVSILTHALAVIGNTRCNQCLNAERAALIGLYHDASEIITGDMPTPIKYSSKEMKNLFHNVEATASKRMLSMLPADMQEAYKGIFFKQQEDAYLWKLMKAADKLSAYIKCLEELAGGNQEFSSAKDSLYRALVKMEKELPELAIFMEEFLPAYGKNLDELQASD